MMQDLSVSTTHEFHFNNSVLCPFDQNEQQAQYAADPCCARSASDTECCKPRDVTLVKDDVITIDVTKASQCQHPYVLKWLVELTQQLGT